MRLTTMAWRTLSRNRRRTLITSLSVAFGIFLAVTLTGSGDYSYTNMINTSTIMGMEPPGTPAVPTPARTESSTTMIC